MYFAVNDKTLFIENFNYDGKGADAVFWVGGTTEPDSTGFMVHVGQDSEETIGPFKDQNLILHLPAGIKITDLRWLSVWSRKFSMSFGSVIFPKIVAPPRPTVIGPLNNTREGVSSGDILVIDSQTFFIPNFNYDGSGQNVRWWASKESKTNLEDLPLYDEGGRDLPLQQYQNETVIISLPDGYSVFDYRFLNLWSSSENENYGSVEIPSDLNIPPSPRILDLVTEHEINKFNCEMLNDNLGLQVRWLIKGNDIIIHLVGNIGKKFEYMALGFSKDDTETKFDGADAAITWLDKDGKGHVVDYYLENTEICENGHGMCPDVTYEGSGNNLILLSAKKFNGTTTITFKRPLKAEDKLYDQNIYTDGPQAVLWAIGSIQDGNLVASPTVRTKGNLLLDFGRDPNWNCPPLKDDGLQLNTVQHHQFEIRCPSDHLFRAQMGPSPYQNISNVWYINGLPTPQLTVQRGQEYVFIVEGGMGPSVRNPLYITDSEEGGLYQNLLENKHVNTKDIYVYVQDINRPLTRKKLFFAGVHHDVVNSLYFPTSEGRLCQWSISDEDPEHSVTTSFADSTSALMLSCEPGNPARLIWTPDVNTPDNLYYQSFTEKHLGGKIRVLDFCEETTSHSYLQNASSIIAEKSRIKGGHFKPELEREQDFKELEHITNSDSSNKETEVENEQQDLEQEVGEQYKNTINKIPDNSENNLSLKNQRSANIISHQGEENRNIEFDTIKNNSSEEIEISDSSFIEAPLSLDIFQPLMSDALHPHDESERSDKNIHQHQNSEATTVQHNKIPVGVHTTHEKPQMNQKIPSFAVFRNEPPKTPREPPRFRPQFQGGFVPLVLNPVKEKESSSSHNLDLAASHFRRPHRPFLFNESIPFHGTFKPGVPDFSGFNISHYTQDESYPLNHVLDNLPALTGSNPQMIQRPLTSMNGLPPELFQRQPGPAQRLQIFGYLPRQKPLGFGFYRQPAGLSQLPNIRRPNSGEDELSEISSQRVPVAFQSSVENKGKGEGMPHLQIMHIPDRKLKNKPQTNNVIHTPPIQRRPDFVGEGEAPLNSPLFKPPQMHNYPERLPVKNNENLENQRAPTTMKFNGLRNPQGMKQPVPLVKTPFNGMERDNLPSRIPPRGFLRKPNPFIQNSQKEMLPHFPGSQRDTPFLHKAPSHSDIIKPRDRVPNISTSNKFHHRPSMVNPTVVKSAESNEKVKTSEDLELPFQKTKKYFHHFYNRK
ncbi:hypothetical protein CEXT_127471 [Caerostris extrusa]|uniref:Protein Skeletor n=1 Tax=Caerostris extrusa TaxID=172846 RepID=A0AAV4Y0G3_CAEEX|nr:hypothetical protein CEXT_127471 [Caerostris extrusa]